MSAAAAGAPIPRPRPRPPPAPGVAARARVHRPGVHRPGMRLRRRELLRCRRRSAMSGIGFSTPGRTSTRIPGFAARGPLPTVSRSSSGLGVTGGPIRPGGGGAVAGLLGLSQGIGLRVAPPQPPGSGGISSRVHRPADLPQLLPPPRPGPTTTHRPCRRQPLGRRSGRPLSRTTTLGSGGTTATPVPTALARSSVGPAPPRSRLLSAASSRRKASARDAAALRGPPRGVYRPATSSRARLLPTSASVWRSAAICLREPTPTARRRGSGRMVAIRRAATIGARSASAASAARTATSTPTGRAPTAAARGGSI